MTSKYRVYRDAGLCGGCGKLPPLDDKIYCQKCTEKQAAYHLRRRSRCLNKSICPTCKVRPLDLLPKRTCSICLEFRRQRRIELRNLVLMAYGGPICKCCGETEIDFLQIDHIDGGGKKHSKQINHDLYRWLKKNNFPPGFQVLCCNCNFAKGAYGTCPHQRKVSEVG